MRILILSQWFQPEPTFKGLPFAKELAARGHQVQVLTGFPNYPGGKLYPGYRVRFWQKETVDGISIIRVPLYPSHDQSGIRRIANYTSFALSAALLGSLLVDSADVMYVYHPPATIGLPAIVISILRRIPFVYDIQDLWPDTLASTRMVNNQTVLGLVGRWCKFVYRRASHIAVLSPGFKSALIARGVPAEKIDVIFNWCDETQAVDTPRETALAESLGLTGKFTILFAGTMGKAQAMDSVLDAASILAEQLPSVRFLLVGGGIEVDRLEARVVSQRVNNIVFVPRQPMSEMQRYMALADVLLVHLRKDQLFRITIPSKTQAYLAAGKPILMAVEGDAADLITAAGAGINCEPENPNSLVNAVTKLFVMDPAQRMETGRLGKSYYWKYLSVRNGLERFENILSAATRQR